MNRQNNHHFWKPALRALNAYELGTILTCVWVMTAACGCATKKVQSQPIVTESRPRPNHVLIYDFVTTPDQVPSDSTIAREFSVDTGTQTDEQKARGREVGARIAAQLVPIIQGMGFNARQVAIGETPPTEINDVVLRGYLVSLKEGSATKRIAIGFGAGASELHAVMEGFQVTEQGLLKLGSGTGKFGGSKNPGAAVGAVGFLATANPAGLIVSSGVKVYGEVSGGSKIEGRAEKAAKEIGKELERRARARGWIN